LTEKSEGKMQDESGYRQLIVWNKAFELVPEIYRITRSFPREERFGLVDQLRRASVSVAANIAEGHGRNGSKEFVHFLGISRGSLAEVDTLIALAGRLELLENKTQETLLQRIKEIRKLLHGLSKKLQSR
jgi:four helix bundle protein